MPLDFPQPIADDALDLTPANPEFSHSFADIVGNAVTDSDGFEVLFSDAADALTGIADLLGGLETHEGDIGAAAADAATTWEHQFADSVASTITQGQPDFDQFGVDLTGGGPPPPPGGVAAKSDTLKIVFSFTGAAGSPQTLCVGVNVI